jgi:hypothetical protein
VLAVPVVALHVGASIGHVTPGGGGSACGRGGFPGWTVDLVGFNLIVLSELRRRKKPN